MNILFAIQGTGNGHISRARDIYPILCRYGRVDTLISGIQADVDPGFPVTFRLGGMGFIFGKKGNVDLIKTFRKCVTRAFLREIREFPIRRYDLVINDFEPVSAWAARAAQVPCYSLSHQYAVLHPGSPRPEENDWIGRTILAHYAPVQGGVGFHFAASAPDIFTPVIRRQVRECRQQKGEHVCVYLPAYDNARLLKVLSQMPGQRWEVFSKHTTRQLRLGPVHIRPVQNEAFLESMASSRAVLCGAGFETPAEALFLGKPLMVIPMKNQFEQQCNAAALSRLGIPAVKSLKKKHIPAIREWLENGKVPTLAFPDQTEQAVARLMQVAGFGERAEAATARPGKLLSAV